MGIGVLGPTEIDGGRFPLGSRDRAVLAALVLRSGEVVSLEELADTVWGAEPPASWSKNLQGCVSRLRQHLGAGAIRTSGQGYRLSDAAVEVDSREFARLVDRAQELLALGEPERAAQTATQALALWRGRPFPELEEWEPGVAEVGRLTELRLEAEELYVEAALHGGYHRDTLARAQAMVDAAPLRERRWVLLAKALYQSGQQAAALSTLRRLRTLLSRDVGIDPGEEATQLELGILRQDPALLVQPAPQATSQQCPYLGLTSYAETDADLFFGRDREIESCLARINEGGLLAVVGPSGSGKSSLVRAGIAAGLRRQGRGVVVFSPGAHPLATLAATRGDQRSAMVVDQAEELFAFCDEPDERERFLAALADHAAGAPVVVALRADRMGELAAHPAFARLVEAGLFLIGAMSEDDLRAAIERPARQAGLLVEPGLVDLLVREVEGEPGALPLLSHALRETWLRREVRTLTVAGYQESGGIRGAIAKSAEDVYASIDPERRHLLRDLLLRLVNPGVEGLPVRARVPRRLVIVDPAQDRLIDVLIASRLVTSDDGVIELAHEALARAWPRLQGWLDDDLEGQRILHHLAGSADAWDQLGRPDSELYRGVRLTQVVAWSESSLPELTATERDFIDASCTVADFERHSAEVRAREQARMIRRLRLVVAGAAVLLVVALVAGLLTVRQTRLAQAADTASEARRAGARALQTEDIDTSLLLAVAGTRLDDSQVTRANLLASLAKWPQLIRSVPYAGDEITGLQTSPDGSTMAVYDGSGHVRLLDTTSWEGTGDLDPGTAPKPLPWARAAPIAFSRDGGVLAVGMPPLTEDPVRLLDSATLDPLPVQLPGLPTEPVRVVGLTYSADDTALAVTYLRFTRDPQPMMLGLSLMVWDVTTRAQPVVRMRKELGGKSYWDTQLVELSPDGRTVYARPFLRAYDVATGTRLYQVSDEAAQGSFLDLSPDGQAIAIASIRPNTLRLLDARSGQLLRELRGLSEPVLGVRFSHDGTMLAAASEDQTAVVYDVETGDARHRLQLGEGRVQALAFSPDDDTLYTGGRDAIRVWDLAGDRSFVSRSLEPVEQPGAPDIAPGGRYTLGFGDGGVIRFTTVATGARTGYLEGSAQKGGDWNSSGDRWVSVGEEFVRIWDPSGPTVVRQREFPGHTFNDARFSPDGTRIALSEASGRVSMLDAASLSPIGRPVLLDEPVGGVFLGADNRSAFLLAPPSYVLDSPFEVPTGGWVLVDLETGALIKRGSVDLAGGVSWLARSLDGALVALGGVNGEVVIVDVESGRPIHEPTNGHVSAASWLAFSADGSRLVTSDGGSVSLWDGVTGELLGTASLPERNSASVEFAADNQTVLIETVRDAVYRWDTRAQHAVDFACRLAGRDFTEAEWSEQFGERPYQTTCTA